MERIVIAGAGVIGLATALELAGRGYQVTVLERGTAFREASWAAAGMLAAEDPENPAELAEFARFSRSLYPAFLARLEQLSGIAVPLRTTRTLQVGHRLATAGHAEPANRIAHDEARRRIPGLQVQPEQLTLWLEESSLDPRDLGRALTAAVRAAGIELLENTPVVSCAQSKPSGGHLVVSTTTGAFEADAMIVATGAWAATAGGNVHLHGLAAGWVGPRKGQMLRMRQPAGSALTVVLRSPTVYIVPRADGSLIVGATVEDAGYDRTAHDEATEWLLKEAARLWWPVAGITRDQIEEVWTGIRPATPDSLPILGSLGPYEAWPKVLVATGHYRNGILLAPGTARVIGQLLSDEAVAIDLTSFSPRRMLTPSDLDASNPCCHDKETSAAL